MTAATRHEPVKPSIEDICIERRLAAAKAMRNELSESTRNSAVLSTKLTSSGNASNQLKISIEVK